MKRSFGNAPVRVANIDLQFSIHRLMDHVTCVTTKFRNFTWSRAKRARPGARGASLREQPRNKEAKRDAGKREKEQKIESKRKRIRGRGRWEREREKEGRKRDRETNDDEREGDPLVTMVRPYDPLATTHSRMPPSNATLPLVLALHLLALVSFLSHSLSLSVFLSLPPGTM